MSIILFDPELVIERVSAEVPELRLVTGAADLPAALAQLKTSPAAFVVPIRDDAGPNLVETVAVVQLVPTRFGLVFAVQNLRDTSGRAAHSQMRTLRLKAAAALHGWRPSVTGEDWDPYEYAGGRLLQLSDSVLWWQDDWRTSDHWRST